MRKQRLNKTTEPLKTQSDRDNLASYLWNRNLRDYALFYFMLNTGRRISDAVKLNVNDVAYMNNRGKFSISERLKIYEKKTGKFIDLILNNDVRRALSKYLRQRKRASQKSGYSVAEFLREPLFKSQKASRNGEKRLTAGSAWRIFRDSARVCGIKAHIGTHSLRKTCGYMLHERGVSINLLQKIFNHSSPEITLDYIGITREDIDEAFLSLESDVRFSRFSNF